MNVITQPMEFEEAVRKLGDRTPVGSSLRTEGWAKVPLALRERASFSAGVESARVVQRIQDNVLGSASRAEFVANTRKFLLDSGFAPAGSQSDLTQVTSTRRLELLFEHNTESARGYGWWKQGQDPQVLDAFPAQALVRIESREVPRDWTARWTQAGGRLWDGRMIALKADPVWRRISRFGTPWPPYDFGSGMGVEDVSREDAEAMGLLKTDEPVQGDEADFNAELQASVRGLDPERIEDLELAFGDQVAFVDRQAIWKQRGAYTDWQAKGLDSVRSWSVDAELPPRMSNQEGVRRMAESETAKDYTGRDVHFTAETLAHWQGKADEADRASYLPAALQTVQDPLEVWTQATQDAYFAAYSYGARRRGVLVFVNRDTRVARTYFMRDLNGLDKARKGLSVWQKGAAP